MRTCLRLIFEIVTIYSTVVKSQTKTISKLDVFLDCAVELFSEKGKNLQLDSMAYTLPTDSLHLFFFNLLLVINQCFFNTSFLETIQLDKMEKNNIECCCDHFQMKQHDGCLLLLLGWHSKNFEKQFKVSKM